MAPMPTKSVSITCAQEAASALQSGFPRQLRREQECFVALALDTQNAPLGKPWLCAVGTVNSVAVAVRDVFREAISRNAVGIIVAHNHPSGGLEPSQEDRELTSRLVAAGKLLGIPLLDHLILGRFTGQNGYTSLAERGVLK